MSVISEKHKNGTSESGWLQKKMSVGFTATKSVANSA